jgi:uncharacterized protein (TIGR00299 family) protein
MRILFIDCAFAGISGDLLLSSLASIVGIDSTEQYLKKIITKISPDHSIQIKFDSKISQGIKGTYLNLEIPHQHNNKPHAEMDEIQIANIDLHHHHIEQNHIIIQPKSDIQHQHPHQHPHQHDHTGQHHHDYSIQDQKQDLEHALDVENISPLAKNYAKTVLNQIIEAEAEVHGIDPEKVHLHEISALDTVLDIAGTTYLLDKLGVFNKINPTQVYFTPIAVGGGTVTCSHGILPVPAPATSIILTKNHLQLQYGPVNTELATPTGVSLLAGLVALTSATQVSHPPGLQIEKQGIGVGTKSLDNRPNILRIYQGSILQNGLTDFSEPVFILETNVDDVSGELLGFVMEKLIKGGAHDVSFISATTKKNRPEYIIKVITEESLISQLTKILMEETGTLGVRVREERRICLPREIIERKIVLEEKEFTIRVKRSFSPAGEIFQEKVEFEDIRKIAEELGLPFRQVDRLVKKML